MCPSAGQSAIPGFTSSTATSNWFLSEYPGELFIGGEGVAAGYWNQPELTAGSFVADPFFPGRKPACIAVEIECDGLRGNLEFLGRTDEQVKIFGFGIEPGEIEAVLGSHPAVRQCVVTVRDGPLGDKRLVAYWVARPDAAATPHNLREYVRAKLPDYMVPAVFVRMEGLPLTPNGKVDRGALPPPDAGRRSWRCLPAQAWKRCWPSLGRKRWGDSGGHPR